MYYVKKIIHFNDMDYPKIFCFNGWFVDFLVC